jgi:hypothetical protein
MTQTTCVLSWSSAVVLSAALYWHSRALAWSSGTICSPVPARLCTCLEQWPYLQSCTGTPVYWYTHKTSGFKTSGFKTSGFKTSSFKMSGYKTSGLQNVRFTKRQVSKCLVSKSPVFKFDILIKQKV